MDEEREEDGDEIDDTNASSLQDQEKHQDLAGEIVGVIESVAQFGDYRRTQRKECHNLSRKMKLLLPFLEEIRDIEGPVSENGVSSLRGLKNTLLSGKKLLKTCNEESKIYLAVENESLMIRFHSFYEKLYLALANAPFDELQISDEVKEQIELMCTQLRRAKVRTEAQDIELAVDMMAVLSKTGQRNADSAIIERLAIKLDLHTVQDLNIETIAIRNLLKDKRGHTEEYTQQLVDLLNKFKKVLGMEITNIFDDPVQLRVLAKSTSLTIPYEFLCPITLEIMSDPVIVASGQTYERESIQKWFDSNHQTCPKTRQNLDHLSFASNYALKNLISEWCEQNHFKLSMKESLSCSESVSFEHKEDYALLVEELSSNNLEVQRKAVKRIRILAKESPENRVSIANGNGIPPLVQLLCYPDSQIQEDAVTALLNLSIDESNKKLISNEGAIPAIIEILEKGSTGAKENSAATLFSLSMLDENKVIIGLSDGIPPLVELLQSGTLRGKRDAATALFNLLHNSSNKVRAIDACIVPSLIQLLQGKKLGMVDEALSIFLLLASHQEGRHAIGQLSFIEILVEIIREGTPKNKECAASVLLELGSSDSQFILAALQFGVYDHLVEMLSTGANRAQRKANALIQLMSTSEQIP